MKLTSRTPPFVILVLSAITIMTTTGPVACAEQVSSLEGLGEAERRASDPAAAGARRIRATTAASNNVVDGRILAKKCPNKKPKNRDSCTWKGACKYRCCCDKNRIGSCRYRAQCRGGKVRAIKANIKACKLGCDAKGKPIKKKKNKNKKPCPAKKPKNGAKCSWRGKTCKYNCCCNKKRIGSCGVRAICRGGRVSVAVAKMKACKLGCDAQGKPLSTRTGDVDVCSLPGTGTGRCKAKFIRYFYNNQTNLCERFIYGGCGGNENNFERLAACKATCGGN